MGAIRVGTLVLIGLAFAAPAAEASRPVFEDLTLAEMVGGSSLTILTARADPRQVAGNSPIPNTRTGSALALGAPGGALLILRREEGRWEFTVYKAYESPARKDAVNRLLPPAAAR